MRSAFIIRCRPLIAAAVTILALGLAGIVEPCAKAIPYSSSCVGFESLSIGNTYAVGDVFTDSGATIEGKQFYHFGGAPAASGQATVGVQGAAGGMGREMWLNNIRLGFDFGPPLDELALRIGELGGTVNIEINGDLRYAVSDLPDLHGTSIGGATVLVLVHPGTGHGWLRVQGAITSFSIGGQELAIDEVCPNGGCVDFETLPYPASYGVGSTFTDSGAQVQMQTFFWWDGNPNGGIPYSGGSCVVDNQQRAGGSGLDVLPNNINMDFDFGTMYRSLRLLYADLGGNLNLRINGDFRNIGAPLGFASLNGTTLGGATIMAAQAPDGLGVLEVRGYLSSFTIGGQELWIDDVCIQEMLFGDGFESGNTTAWSVTQP
jgi:hypothetical protein